MLIKLIKYDLKWLFKSVLPVSCVTGLLIILMGVSQRFELLSQMNVITALTMMFVTFGIICGAVAGFIFSFMRFYRNLLTDEAYLSFSLPVTATQQLCSKTISAIIMLVIHSAVIAASALVAILINLNFISTSEFLKFLGYGIKEVLRVAVGSYSTDVIIMIILYLIMSNLALIYVIFDAMTISSFARRGKGIITALVLIAAGFILGIMQQGLMSGFIAIFGAKTIYSSTTLALMPTVVSDIIVVVVSFVLLRGMFDKHINLN